MSAETLGEKRARAARLKWVSWTPEARSAEMSRIASFPRKGKKRFTKADEETWRLAVERAEKRAEVLAGKLAQLKGLEKELKSLPNPP